MMRVLYGILGAGALATAVSVPPSPATLLDRDELQACRGAADSYCSIAIADVAGIDCHECTTNGNGGSFKCDTSANDMTSMYISGQSPALRVPFDETNCSGGAKNFAGGGCTGNFQWEPCNRTFTRAGSPSPAPGVNCP